MGDDPNRNKAASYAQGKYIKYLDADDILYPHGLQVMVFYMKKFPAAALALTCYASTSTVQPFPILLTPREVNVERFFGKGFMTIPPWSPYKREIFEELGGFRTERYIGDTDMWLRISP